MEALNPSAREAEALVALLAMEGIGSKSAIRLREQHGSARAALTAVGGERYLAHAAGIVGQARERGARVIPLGEPDYPACLLDLPDPPAVLYVSGRGWPDFDRAVAVVGTRCSSAYGRRMANRLGRDLARWGWTVVSGMAAGIDAVAQGAALDAGGTSVGVLGTGLGREYPAVNRPLYRRMRRGGWLVSELPPSTPPTRAAFPQRNRLIAAMSRATIVVEAGDRSGALVTARLALELGREVLAVPARVGDRTGVGTLRLLRDGAGMATNVRDVFDAIGWIHDYEPPAERPSAAPNEGPDAWLLAGLENDELTADGLAARCGRSIADTLAALARLEVDGRVERSSSGLFAVTPGNAPANAVKEAPAAGNSRV